MVTTEPLNPERIGRLLQAKTYTYVNERELHASVQREIGAMLQDHRVDGAVLQSEARLGPPERIDLLLVLPDGVRLGIEIKVKGDAAAVHSQLGRYAYTRKLDHLMIVTTQRRHLIGLPDWINDVPIHCVLLRSNS